MKKLADSGSSEVAVYHSSLVEVVKQDLAPVATFCAEHVFPLVKVAYELTIVLLGIQLIVTVFRL